MTSHSTAHPRRDEDGAFHADVDVATATVNARGVLDLLTVDALQGAIDVLTIAGRTDITLDFTDVSSVDRAAVWCIANMATALTTRHGRLTITHARDTVHAALGDLCREPRPTQGRPLMPEPEDRQPAIHDPAETDQNQEDVMGGPDQPSQTEDVMGGANQPPAGDDVMAPHGDAATDRDAT